jgi:hypothetical protein
MLNAGTVDWEAYVWAEGFDNWLPMRDVEDLVGQITGEAAPRAEPAQPAIKTSTLVGQPSMGADPFADDVAPSAGRRFGAAPPSNADQDLFASSAERSAQSPFPSAMDRPGVVASSASRADASLTGARNENSVLFSLKNLQALATGSSTPSMPPGGGGGDRGAGFATGEGSGLIDIRALASATGIGDGGAGSGSKDDLLSLGSQGGAFGALGSPILSPVGDSGEGSSKTLIWALVAGVAFLSAAGVAVVYILRAPTPQPAAAVGMVAAGPVATAAPAVAAPAPTAAAPAPTEGELAAAKAATENRDKAGAEPTHGASGSHARHGSADKSAIAEPTASTKSEPEPEQHKAPEKPSGPRSIDSLLDSALSGSSKPAKAPAAAPSSNLPDSPSKPEVITAMNAIKADVVRCGNGQGGVATVTISVAGATGRVTNAQVGGVTGPAGSCIAQAVRKAQFQKFQQKVFKLVFPFKL